MSTSEDAKRLGGVGLVEDQRKLVPVKRFGPSGRSVVVIHGGPGARGSAGLLARALADPLHVLEPWQRLSSDTPLSVAQHIEDLAGLIVREIPGESPVLVGESWGAMLALAFASTYPGRVSALALVGCGTFDRTSRARLHQSLAERTTKELEEQLAQLATLEPDENERIAQAHALSDPLYTYSRAIHEPVTNLDLKGHTESWSDMIRLQDSGVYPAAFEAITCPVLMLHGSYDPHPGALIRDGLLKFIPELEYIELDRCGHSPWIEEHARDRFLSILRSWLEQQLA
jgi:pimeloyl-ACP methyl ester carboxylesterase